MKIVGWWVIIGILAAGAAGRASAPPASTPLTDPTAGARAGPSFSCASANAPVERTICADRALAAADSEMATLFALVRTSAFGNGPSNQLAAQRSALKEMRNCADPSRSKDVTACLRDAYTRRNQALAVAALMIAPDSALPVLRRIDPGVAPLLEATGLWAAQPVDANWSAPERAKSKSRIVALLNPYFNDLMTNEDQSFGRSIMTDPGLDGVAVTNIADVFKSDRHFAAFLNVLGPYLPSPQAPGFDAQRSLPCAAIVRHPALLRATTSLYGSTMDNFVLNNDCEQALPPAPALAALDEKLNQAWPECDGTIRFAAYRAYQTALDEARLGRPPHDAKAVIEKRSGIAPADVAAARRELSAYYTQYLAKSPLTADVMAKDALAAVTSAAHECGG